MHPASTHPAELPLPRRTSLLVLGLGASGRAAAVYAAARPERFGPVVAVDAADSPALREAAAELEVRGVRVFLGSDGVEGRFELCVASPGIPPYAPLARAAATASERMISEIEFAYEESRSTWVAVTGTNGKTTTTALIAHLLREGGVAAVSVGNIGTPAIEAVAEAGEDAVLVAEVSSFQLALTENFHPRVAVLLNVTPDHVDWHGSLKEYAAAKARVFANIEPGDAAVIDCDDTGATMLLSEARERRARIVRVSTVSCGTAEACIDDRGALRLLGRDGEPITLLGADELQIKGDHNVSNALAAAAAVFELGVTPEDLRAGLASFRPIEHRLEPVGEVAGAYWFNDSKATNPDAVSKALGAFGERPLVVLLGGRNKGNDFGSLATQVAERVRAAVVFGEAREDIGKALRAAGLEPTVTPTLTEAVTAAASIAERGDAVVLSPACASFDEFSSYEERGQVFKDLVKGLAS